MPVRLHIAKEATPEQVGWRARIAANEPTLAATFLAWVAALHAQIQESQILHALIAHSTGIFDHVVQSVAFRPDLAPVAEKEGELAFDQLIHDLRPTVRLSLDLRDPNFLAAVDRHQAAMVREVTDETRRAVANMIGRGYLNGVHPVDVAKTIREAVGLTSRQAQAVLNFHQAQLKAGVRAEVAVDRAMRYAGRMRSRRAQTIARTETARAAVLGRLASYEQAAARGLFDRAQAQLEWSSVQTDPEEICAQLDGERVPFGQTFDGLLPPAHPCCRCSVHLVLPAPAARPTLTLVR